MAEKNGNGTIRRTLWMLIVALMLSSFGFTMYVLSEVYSNAQNIIRNEKDIEFIKEKVKDNNEMLKIILEGRKK